jgi:hypothetical protein
MMMNTSKALVRSLFAVVGGLAACSAYGQQANPYLPPPSLSPELQAQVKEAAAKPTPHLADGSIDLGGYWQVPNSHRGGIFGPPQPTGPDNTINVFPPGATVVNVNAQDKVHADERRANTALRPKYKAAYAAKANENFDKGDLADPTYGCQLPGVVRLGLPNEIFQRSGSIALMYGGLVNRYRVVPVDGTKPEKKPEPLPMGHPVGHWEGSTLIIETNGFVPDYWLDHDGSYHSGDLKLTEKLTRQGNTLKYEMVAEDPIFAEPFKALSSTLILGPGGKHVDDEYGCDERDITHMVNGAKH